jgi:FAD/FMN-containing dehydrogenase
VVGVLVVLVVLVLLVVLRWVRFQALRPDEVAVLAAKLDTIDADEQKAWHEAEATWKAEKDALEAAEAELVVGAPTPPTVDVATGAAETADAADVAAEVGVDTAAEASEPSAGRCCTPVSLSPSQRGDHQFKA